MTVKKPFFPIMLAAAGQTGIVDPPVAAAARLSLHENAKLYIVHAVTSAGIQRDANWPPQKSPAGHSRPLPSFPMTARRLATLYADEYPQLTIDDIRITSGVAWEAIFKNATDLESSLIALGPHNEQFAAEPLSRVKGSIGSTAEGVMRHALCPVMIINRCIDAERLKFKRIVVGIDFSQSCASALCLTALLSAHFNSSVHPFHMLPVPPYPKYTPQSFKADLQRIKKQLGTLCRQLLQDIDYQIRIKPGTIPHAALLRHAQKIEADLIVIGSHTKETAGKWYPGSVAQQISLQASCPVIVVNGQEALTPWKDDPLTRKLSSIEIPRLTLFPA